jgi:hypothetical protein
VGLEEPDLRGCDLTALPEGIGRLTGLKELELGFNHELTALPAGLWTLSGLEELHLYQCWGLRALPGGGGGRWLVALPEGGGWAPIRRATRAGDARAAVRC